MILAGSKITCTECGINDEPLIVLADGVYRCTKCAYQIAAGKRAPAVFVCGDPEGDYGRMIAEESWDKAHEEIPPAA